MTRALGSSRRLLPWLAVALVGAAVGIGLQMTLGSEPELPAVSVAAREPATGAVPAQPAVASASETEAGASDAAPPVGSAPLAGPDPAAHEATITLDEPAPDTSSVEVHPLHHLSTGIRLRVPILGIDADVVELGFRGDGQLDVPSQGSAVGWYDISPRPGAQGNALLGAHFDWNGAAAVFARLSELGPGDRIILSDGGLGDRVYEVSVSTSIAWDHPLGDVLATHEAGSSLTLFTCGGSFDSARSEYDERVLVRAVELDLPGSLTALR